MSTSKVKPDEFSSYMKKMLDFLPEETLEKVNETAKAEANQCVREMRSASKEAFGTGKYQRGWTKRQKKQEGGYKGFVIYNKTRYMLTHLLEFGHEIWYYSPKLKKPVDSGKRSKPITHIRPVAEKSSERYYKNVKEALLK